MLLEFKSVQHAPNRSMLAPTVATRLCSGWSGDLFLSCHRRQRAAAAALPVKLVAMQTRYLHRAKLWVSLKLILFTSCLNFQWSFFLHSLSEAAQHLKITVHYESCNKGPSWAPVWIPLTNFSGFTSCSYFTASKYRQQQELLTCPTRMVFLWQQNRRTARKFLSSGEWTLEAVPL